MANGNHPYDGAQDMRDAFGSAFESKFGVSPLEFNDKPHQKKRRVVEKLEKLHDSL
jgi:hypothetical protein